MKRLLFIILSVFAFVACEDEKGQLAGDAKIYINGRDRANKTLVYQTAHELLCGDSIYMRIGYPDRDSEGSYFWCFKMGNIDTINNRLVMEAGNISGIDDNPLFRANRLVLTTCFAPYDTIGYISHQQVQDAYSEISALWETEDWDKIYKIFSNAFTFVPCDGEECKAYIASGY